MASKPSFAGQALGLFTDVLVGIRAALKVLGGTDAHLEKLREPRFFEIAAAYAMGKAITISAATQATVDGPIQLMDRTIWVTMDLSRTVEQMIADGKYNYVDDNIFKMSKLTLEAGTKSLEVILLYYDKYMVTQAVLADMERQELRAATLQELFWIGIQHPLLQLNFPIAALGSVVEAYNTSCFASLGRTGRNRGIGLSGSGWHNGHRFAAVRK